MVWLLRDQLMTPRGSSHGDRLLFRPREPRSRPVEEKAQLKRFMASSNMNCWIYGSLSLRFPTYNLCCTVVSDRLIESLDATVKSLDLTIEGTEELPGVIGDELCVTNPITDCQNGESRTANESDDAKVPT